MRVHKRYTPIVKSYILIESLILIVILVLVKSLIWRNIWRGYNWSCNIILTYICSLCYLSLSSKSSFSCRRSASCNNDHKGNNSEKNENPRIIIIRNVLTTEYLKILRTTKANNNISSHCNICNILHKWKSLDTRLKKYSILLMHIDNIDSTTLVIWRI